MRGLVTFNIADNSKTYNKYPVVLYYDGKEAIVTMIQKEEKVIDYIIDNALSLSNVSSLSIHFVSYMSDDFEKTEEKVEHSTISANEIIDFMSERVIKKFIKEAMTNVFKTDDIKSLLDSGLSVATIVNGVRMKTNEYNIDRPIVTAIIKQLQDDTK